MRSNHTTTLCAVLFVFTAPPVYAALPLETFHVTVTPACSLSYTYLVYAAAIKGDPQWEFASFNRLDDSLFQAAVPQAFDTAAVVGDETGTYNDPDQYDQILGIVGIYNDANSEVTVSFNASDADSMISQGKPFSQVFPGVNESALAQHLRSGDYDLLLADLQNRAYLTLGQPGKLVNFCFAADGGPVTITRVPETSTFILLSLGAVTFLRRHRTSGSATG